MRSFVFLFFITFFTPILSAQEKVKFFPTGGVHVGLKEIKVDIPDGFSVYYTTDGTTPGRASLKVRGNLKITGNTVFLFAVYDRAGKREQISHSYFTERKHSLPILSIISHPDNFFDSIQGIYEMGCCADTVDPFKGANFWKNWERAIHIEMIENDSVQVLNQEAGIKIFGGYSVSMRQKSFAIYARKKYGNNRFEHNLFPQLDEDKYKTFLLRNAGGDMLGAHMRDVYATQLVKPTGLAIQEYRPVSVYINGEYWGKYNLREKINEHYIKQHFGYDKDSLIIMRHRKEPQHGSTRDYERFISRVPALDLRKPDDLRYMDARMDIDNYMLYNISEIYTGNEDAGGNIRYFKHTSDTAKWRWIFYDLDLGLNINGSNGHKINSVDDFTLPSNELWPNPAWSTLLIRKILENDSLKYRYINRFSDLLNTTFQSERAVKLVNKLEDEVSEEIDYHLKRWHITRGRYNKSVKDLKIFAEERPAYLRQFLAERFELGPEMVVNVKIDKGGSVVFNSLILKDDFKGTYYQGVPLIFEAVPRFDYEFKGWKGLDSDQKAYESFQKDTLILQPVFEKRRWSDYRGRVMITEIDAAQEDNERQGDWLELHNISDQLVDLSGWMIKDGKDDHSFIIPSGVYLDSGSYLIICRDSVSWKKRFGIKSHILGNLSFGFKHGRDEIRLYDSGLFKVDEVDLKKTELEEKDGFNIVKKDFRVKKFSKNNWTLEKASPASASKSYKLILKQEEEDRYWKNVFFYSGISAGALLILLFLFTLLKRRSQT
ncbi:MAG: CotH kinase family protein [Brumimicrobium sp.]|nr:CotH kinase family protein [Brumimicrobium sp.]